MKKYEIMYIINSSVDEAARKELVESFNQVITTNGGEVAKVDEWGLREFAYVIDNMNKGYYVVLTINGTNEGIAEFDRLAGINANIVRHMIVRLDA